MKQMPEYSFPTDSGSCAYYFTVTFAFLAIPFYRETAKHAPPINHKNLYQLTISIISTQKLTIKRATHILAPCPLAVFFDQNRHIVLADIRRVRSLAFGLVAADKALFILGNFMDRHDGKKARPLRLLLDDLQAAVVIQVSDRIKRRIIFLFIQLPFLSFGKDQLDLLVKIGKCCKTTLTGSLLLFRRLAGSSFL